VGITGVSHHIWLRQLESLFFTVLGLKMYRGVQKEGMEVFHGWREGQLRNQRKHGQVWKEQAIVDWEEFKIWSVFNEIFLDEISFGGTAKIGGIYRARIKMDSLVDLLIQEMILLTCKYVYLLLCSPALQSFTVPHTMLGARQTDKYDNFLFLGGSHSRHRQWAHGGQS
jgi:hypothetical protein